MADLGGYEGVRQAPLPGLPDLPGRPIRRSGGGLCPTVLRRTEADGGVSSHPALAVRCCLHPTAGCSPFALLVAEGALLLLHLRSSSAKKQQPSQWLQHGAGRRKASRPTSAPDKPVKCQGRRRPWDGRPGASGSCSSGDGDSTTPSPGGGPGGEFLFCSATGPLVPKNFIRAVSFFSGSQEGEDGSTRDPRLTFPSPRSSPVGIRGPVRGRDAFSRAPCPAVEPGECCTTHSDPTSRRSAFRVGPLGSTALPHRGYVYVSPGPACTAPGGLA